MPVPTHIFDPPFNIIRCSHAVLDVVDLGKSRAFYENTVGLHVEDADDKAVYLRGSEEHQHHSLVLRKATAAACSRLGFKVGNDGDLDKAADRLPSVAPAVSHAMSHASPKAGERFDPDARLYAAACASCHYNAGSAPLAARHAACNRWLLPAPSAPQSQTVSAAPCARLRTCSTAVTLPPLTNVAKLA